MNNTPDDELAFRDQLATRIRRYAEQRDRVQHQLVELNHTLIATQQRLDAAVEMFRLEFNSDPPLSGLSEKATPIAELVSVVDKRRVRQGGPSWNDAVVQVLIEAGSPLHLNEIWKRMRESGFQTESKDPRRSLASVLGRHPDIVRTGPNMYGLTSPAAQTTDGGPQLHIEQSASSVRTLREDQEIAT
jgi:hypothetical protein